MLMRSPLARDRRSPSGFIRPCQAILADAPPTGPQWLHEIKHDGFRIIAHKQGDRVRLWSRNGRNWSAEFVAITAAMREFRGDVILDGEAVAHCDEGLPDFNALVGRHGCASAVLFAFDLLLLDREDLRPLPLRTRKERLARALKSPPAAVEHLNGELGPAAFQTACRMGLEGIVSKRADSRYRSGLCRSWVKVKNPGYERRRSLCPCSVGP